MRQLAGIRLAWFLCCCFGNSGQTPLLSTVWISSAGKRIVLVVLSLWTLPSRCTFVRFVKTPPTNNFPGTLFQVYFPVIWLLTRRIWTSGGSSLIIYKLPQNTAHSNEVPRREKLNGRSSKRAGWKWGRILYRGVFVLARSRRTRALKIINAPRGVGEPEIFTVNSAHFCNGFVPFDVDPTAASDRTDRLGLCQSFYFFLLWRFYLSPSTGTFIYQGNNAGVILTAVAFQQALFAAIHGGRVARGRPPPFEAAFRIRIYPLSPHLLRRTSKSRGNRICDTRLYLFVRCKHNFVFAPNEATGNIIVPRCFNIVLPFRRFVYTVRYCGQNFLARHFKVNTCGLHYRAKIYVSVIWVASQPHASKNNN